ncbi:MAG: hypothetical protein AB1810_08300 [Pseudomonadota bacterium]
MTEIMIVMMVVMLVAVFGSGHKGMMGHHEAADTEQVGHCDQRGQADCPPPSVPRDDEKLNEQEKSETGEKP